MKSCLVNVLLMGFLLLAFCICAQESNHHIKEGVAYEESSAMFNNGDVSEPMDIALAYIHAHLAEWKLTQQDIAGMTVNDMYTDKSSGITRVYFLQHYRSIPVHNALLNINITKEGEVFFAGNRFVPNLADKVNTTIPVLRPDEAILRLVEQLELPVEAMQMKKQEGQYSYTYESTGIAREDIAAGLSYQVSEESVLLAWDILLAPQGNHDKWSSRVDAVTGAVLDTQNWTIYCPVKQASIGREDNSVQVESQNASSAEPVTGTGAQYRVWPAPTESPAHGPHMIVTDPADPVASPYGWHDINGQPGPEYTITRGNNACVYQDRNNLGHSSNDEPDGGPGLHFDFPFNAQWMPEQYVDASSVNLFYWLSYMHDFSYHFGFDEPAGNFQINNYGNGGLGNDWMLGITQAGANAGIFDYPHYSHGNDGTRGVVFLEESIRSVKFLTVEAPQEIAGLYHTAVPSGAPWAPGAFITTTPVTGEVVLMQDNIEEPLLSDGCETLVNAAALNGKIALVDRGGCDLAFKALKAQNAGAIGVIIGNHDNEFIYYLYPASSSDQIQIPVVMISRANADLLRQHVNAGLTVSLVDPDPDEPEDLDFGLDNGFIAHEYGHGISWRLAGGPNAACFDNVEQMDEGWSDFFALVATARSGDTGAMTRGFGPYMLDQPTTGGGFRRYKYSTDMEISPLTYRHVAASHDRHDVGEVWGNVLWDMYWAFVEMYGWSADSFDPTSGNHKAIRLAFDGLKNLPCSPGFVDGRDALLAADQSLYGGAHQCMLWEVFARRGLGYAADQGSPFDAGDQTPSFEIPPYCSNSLFISKTVTEFINAGEEIVVTIKVGNFKQEDATGLVVTDEIPQGTSYKPQSSNVPATVDGNLISFDLEDLNFGEERTIVYRLTTDPLIWSQRIFRDDVNAENASWSLQSSCGQHHWAIADDVPSHSGNYAWRAKEIAQTCIQTLELNPDVYAFHVDGLRPVLRFYHNYKTQAGINAGVVEVREVGAMSWKPVDAQMLRNGYPRLTSLYTFARPNYSAFSGTNGEDFTATYVDLSAWSGKDIQIRFRFGTNYVAPTGSGWALDDIEFMDMLTYNGEVCVTSEQGDFECALAPEEGTIVESKDVILGTADELKDVTAKIYPNPASDVVTIALSSDERQDVRISFLTIDGRQLYAKSFIFSGNDYTSIDTRDVPAGIYLVKVSTAEGQFVEKIIVQD